MRLAAAIEAGCFPVSGGVGDGSLAGRRGGRGSRDHLF